ncbi:pro-opiomelanocortin-1-like [Sardina pilchardus]|uniref:pro-opiomelanocortin-1-like n=1 Tax=Sardina pilchardus TaxID=27697 RepID=UPI002E11EE75
MLWRLQMCVCVLLLCVCVCVNASRIRVLCSDQRVCRDMISQEVLLNCLRACAERPGLDSAPPVTELQDAGQEPAAVEAADEEEEEEEEEQGVALRLLLSLLAPPPPLLLRPDAVRSAERRAYSMEHFRWGKPAGRKRRPVKVYASGGVGLGSEVAENRRALASQEDEEEEEEEEEERRQLRGDEAPTKLTYRMKHFRWSHPPPQEDKHYGNKRYGNAPPQEDKRYGNAPPQEDKRYGNKRYGNAAPQEDKRYGNKRYGDAAPQEDKRYGNKRYGNAAPQEDKRYGNKRYGNAAPQEDKRYGGFMKPWAAALTPSHKPLLKLLRHAIARDGQ